VLSTDRRSVGEGERKRSGKCCSLLIGRYKVPGGRDKGKSGHKEGRSTEKKLKRPSGFSPIIYLKKKGEERGGGDRNLLPSRG